MYVGKVLEEDGEDHALDKGMLGMTLPMMRNGDAGTSEKTWDGPEVSELVCS